MVKIFGLANKIRIANKNCSNKNYLWQNECHSEI